jgi:hypothetical protein
LQVSLVLYQLLRATVQQADVGVCARDDLPVHLQDQTQHAVGSRVLRPKVQREVVDLGGDEGF